MGNGSRKGIRANTAKLKGAGPIQSGAQDLRQRHITFSFRYLVRDSEKFGFLERNPAYFMALLERVQEVSKMTLHDFVTGTNRTLRNHRIEFGDSRVSEDSFNIPGDKNKEFDATAWQFSLSANEHGRVHGFFIDNTFYVVWFDPEHRLYPKK